MLILFNLVVTATVASSIRCVWGGGLVFFFIPHKRKLMFHHTCCALRKAGKVDVHVHDDVYINIWLTHVYALVVICF